MTKKITFEFYYDPEYFQHRSLTPMQDTLGFFDDNEYTVLECDNCESCQIYKQRIMEIQELRIIAKDRIEYFVDRYEIGYNPARTYKVSSAEVNIEPIGTKCSDSAIHHDILQDNSGRLEHELNVIKELETKYEVCERSHILYSVQQTQGNVEYRRNNHCPRCGDKL